MVTREDLTGQTFGRLTVLGPAEDYVSPIGKHYARWLCRCVCGNLTTVLSNDLKSGNTRSCSCLRKVTDPESNGRTREDLTGQTFGRLTVLGPAEDYVSPSRKRLPQWLCRCECGKQVTVKGCHLKSGATKSCGCLQKERAGKLVSHIRGDGCSEEPTHDETHVRVEEYFRGDF